MTKEKKLSKSCANTNCENCPLGLENPLCTICQLFYPTTKFKKFLEIVEESVKNAKENKPSGRREI